MQNSTETLLLRQKSIAENLVTLQKIADHKIKIKNQANTNLENERSELKQAEELEQNILSETIQKQ